MEIRPQYLINLLTKYQPCRYLRSSVDDTKLIVSVTKRETLKFCWQTLQCRSPESLEQSAYVYKKVWLHRNIQEGIKIIFIYKSYVEKISTVINELFTLI